MRSLSKVALLLLLGVGATALHPVEALARRSLSFAPGDRSRPHAARMAHRGYLGRGRQARSTRHPRTDAAQEPSRAGVAGDDEGPAAKAVPGKGFTLDHGVLTYPAPARFQPRNLPRH